MGLFDDILRGAVGVGTFGTSELLNEGTGGKLWGPGSTFISDSGSSDPMANLGLPQYADPSRPGYISQFDPATMALAPYAQQATAAIRPDQRGMDRYRTEALRTGPSTWARLARNQLSADESNQRGQMAAQLASQAATGRSQLAMRGGLSGGSAERLATNANRNTLTGAQGLAGQALAGRAQIAAQDEGNRIKMLQGLPEMELNQIKPQQWAAEMNMKARAGDTSNVIAENQTRNAFNMAQYQEMMKAIAARRNSDVALATAPKDRGLLGNIFGGLF